MRNLKELLASAGPFIGLALVFVLFVVIAPPAFYRAYNLKTIATQTVITGIGALGMTFVIVSGGIDLSVGSIIALSTVVMARTIGVGNADAGLWAPLIASLLVLVVAGLCGFVNGFVSSRLGIVPFIVTLGTMQVARGAAKWLGREQTVVASPNWINSFMEVQPAHEWMIFSPGVWLLIVLTAMVSMTLRRTIFGRYAFALGSNEAAARLCGIPVVLYRTLMYVVCGIFIGIAGIMQFANLTVGDPTAAQGMELDIIAAVVIGGGSLSGGEGSALGSLVGALMMAMLRNGCNLVGIPNYVQNILIGVIIVGAVAADRIKHYASSSRSKAAA